MKDMKNTRLTAILLLIALVTGCRSVYNVDRADPEELSEEGTIVFVRPTDYALFGTKSLSDYVEVVYERAQRNEAGLLEVRIGLRDRGGQHFWDVTGPDFPLSAKVAFYEKPIAGQEYRTPPVYETNWQRVVLQRGATSDFRVTCPIKEGASYQVTLSELK